MPGSSVTTEVVPAPQGLSAARAFVRGSAPGRGVRTVLVDKEGHRIGQWGDLDLADLVRQRGWIASPLPVSDLVELVSYALTDGLLQTLPNPTLTTDGHTLRLHGRRHRYPIGDVDFEVRIADSGPAVFTDLEAPEKPAVPPITALAAALTAKDEHAALVAVMGLGPQSEPQDREVVAHATRMHDDQLITEAIVLLGDSPDTRQRLHAAWATLSAADRQHRLALARAAYGPSFSVGD